LHRIAPLRCCPVIDVAVGFPRTLQRFLWDGEVQMIGILLK